MSSVSKDNRFAVIPHWVIRAGLSSGALHLYNVLTMYADNDTGEAFPARSRLAKDMGKSSRRTIDGYIKELKDAKALIVQERYRPGDQSRTSNLYTVITAKPPQNDPEQKTAMPMAADCPQNYTQITTPNLYTVNSEESTEMLHDDTSVPPRDQKNPMAGMTQEQRSHALHLIQAIGGYLKQGYDYWGETVQGLYGDLYWHLEEHTANWGEHDALTDMLNNGKWTFSAKVADPYEAGIELNKMLHTAKYVS